MPKRIANAMNRIDLEDTLSHFDIGVIDETTPFPKALYKNKELYIDTDERDVFIGRKEVSLSEFLLSEFGVTKVKDFLSKHNYDVAPLFSENSLDFTISGEEMTYQGYLSKEIIDKVYNDSINYKSCLLHADTNSGKTYGMVMHRPKGQKVIFLTPFKAQTEQCAKDYSSIAITGKSYGYNFAHISVDIKDNPDIIFCVYDKFCDLIKAMGYSGFNLKDYVLVIDEFHQFLWDCSDEFRGTAIDSILDNKHLFKSWVAITATPFGIKENHFSKVITTKNTSSKPKMRGSLQVVELNTESSYSNELIERLTQHIKENHIPQTQTLVMCESKKQAENLAAALHRKGFLTSYVTSENKGDSDVYSSIVNESKIPSKYDILIFTPLIKSAVNIKSWEDKPIGNIHINLISRHKSNKYDIISQFPARARDGFENLYIYNGGKEFFAKKYGHSFIPKLYDISEDIMEVYERKLKYCKLLNDNSELIDWEDKPDTYVSRNHSGEFKVRLHQVIRQKYSPILHDAVMYNDEAIHYIMEQHGYKNILRTVSLDKIKPKTSTAQDLIENLIENPVYTIRGLKKSLDTSKLPEEYRLEWKDVPLKYRVSHDAGGSYKRKGKILLEALDDGITDIQDLVELIDNKKRKKSKLTDKKVATVS